MTEVSSVIMKNNCNKVFVYENKKNSLKNKDIIA